MAATQKLVSWACNILHHTIPSQVKDVIKKYKILDDIDSMMKLWRQDSSFIDLYRAIDLEWLDLAKLQKSVKKMYDNNLKIFKEPADPAVRAYLRALRKAILDVVDIQFWWKFKWSVDEIIYNVITNQTKKPDTKIFLHWIQVWHPQLTLMWLVWDTEHWIIWDFLHMYEWWNWFFSKKVINIKKVDPDWFKEVRDFYEISRDKWWIVQKTINNSLSLARTLYRFAAYTLNPVAWAVLWVVQTLAYHNLLHPFRWINFKDVRKVMDDFGVLPENSLLNINQLFAEVHMFDSNGVFIENILDKLTAILDKNPKLKEYVMQTVWWIHQIVDLMFDEKIKVAAFLRTLNHFWFSNPNELAKYLEQLKKTDSDVYYSFLKDIKKKSTEIYEEMKWFPVNFWTNKVTGKFWKTFFFFEWFLSSWWLNVMKSTIWNMLKPISDMLQVYWKTWDYKLALKAFKEWFMSEQFLYVWMTIWHAWLMWHRVAMATDDYEPKDQKSFVNKMLEMSTRFNQWLQAFQSNIVGRLYLAWYDWLMYEWLPEWVDNYDMATAKMMQTLMSSFLKEFKTVDPFVTAIKSYNDAKKAWLSDAEAYDVGMTALYQWFSKAFWWYARYLTPTQEQLDDMYWQKTTPADYLSYLIWENVNIFKTKYFELKTIENYINIFKDKNHPSALLNYFTYNLPIFRWMSQASYFAYQEWIKDIVDEMTKDDNLWAIRSIWVVPPVLKNVDTTTQVKWTQLLYNELTKFAPQKYRNVKAFEGTNLIFADDEMRRIFDKVYDHILESQENIYAMKLMDALKNKWTLQAYMELYHSKDWQPDQNMFRWLVQIMWMLDAETPWASRKFLSLYAYDLASNIAKQKYWKYWAQLTPEEQYDIQLTINKALTPFLNYSWKDWYVDFTFQTNMVQNYLKIAKPDLFKKLTDYNNLPDSIRDYIALDVYTTNQILSWDIDAYKIKNIFTKVWQSIKDPGLKMSMITKTLETLDKLHNVSDEEKTAVETWILLANIGILDDLLKKPNFKEKYWQLADSLIQRLWNNNKKIIKFGEEYIKSKIYDNTTKKAWINTPNYYKNKSYSKYTPLYNKLRSYAKTNYPYLQKYWSWYNTYWGTRYTPVYWTSRYSSPYSARYNPYYSRGYNSYRTAAKSRNLINDKKQPVKRSFTIREGRIKPIKPTR